MSKPYNIYYAIQNKASGLVYPSSVFATRKQAREILTLTSDFYTDKGNAARVVKVKLTIVKGKV